MRGSFVRSFGCTFAGSLMKRMASLVWFGCWMSMVVGPSLPRRSTRCGAAANVEPRLCRSPASARPVPVVITNTHKKEVPGYEVINVTTLPARYINKHLI